MTNRATTAFWGLFCGIIILFLYTISSILGPFVISFVVGYLCNPLVEKIESIIGRGISSALVVASLFVGIIGLGVLVVPFAEQQVIELAQKIPVYGRKAVEALQPLIQSSAHYIPPQEMARLQGMINSYLGDLVSWMILGVGRLLSNSLAIANVLLLLLITPLLSFYILRDWKKLGAFIFHYMPRAYSKTMMTLLQRIDLMLSGFLRGQLLVCLIFAAYFSIGLSLAGLDFGVILGLSMGLFAFVPFATATGAFLSVLFAVFQFSDSSSIWTVAAVSGIGTLLEANILTPKLVGDRIGVHPAWIVFSVLSGGALFGFVGILLAIPVAGVIGIVLSFALERYSKSFLYDTTLS